MPFCLLCSSFLRPHRFSEAPSAQQNWRGSAQKCQLKRLRQLQLRLPLRRGQLCKMRSLRPCRGLRRKVEAERHFWCSQGACRCRSSRASAFPCAMRTGQVPQKSLLAQSGSVSLKKLPCWCISLCRADRSSSARVNFWRGRGACRCRSSRVSAFPCAKPTSQVPQKLETPLRLNLSQICPP